ncbi:MAG: tetratricopeptide repeat protein [Sphingomonadales bacterium]
MQPLTIWRIAGLAGLLLLLNSPTLLAQTGFKINIPKPKEYEERVLRSEKTTEGKLRTVPKIIQNTVTHYNFTYNAARILNEVLDRGKASHKDDYSKLISFYNYSLAALKADSIQLDSVIQKASSGIALHDLRNDWVDNLYLLWGAAYYFQQKFDSAYQILQFINYSFAPKEKDGYYKVIGSGRDGNRSNSIASAEKNNTIKKIFSVPPSRNDAFIWQIRNHLAQEEYAEASSLIEVLKKDPAFPKRLQPALEEVMALQYYKLENWDSAALHLTLALSEAANAQERARWEYLIAQLYEKAQKPAEAQRYYQKVIPRTTDLVLEIYARLGALRNRQQNISADINKNVNELLHMATQDKYFEYRDIIYYMAAQMDLTGGNTERAIQSLLESTKANSNGPLQRNKAFLQLAELSYHAGQYKQAAQFYDSLQLRDSSLADLALIDQRKKALQRLVPNIDIIRRQDSLWRIALLPEAERREWARRQVREIKKQQGLSDDPAAATSLINPLQPVVTNTLFTPGNAKGEWYFYNTTSRTRGQTEFKSRWGNRPNSDNWRRLAALQAMMNGALNGTPTDSATLNGKVNGGEIDAESIYDQLPLSEEQLRRSRDSISLALFHAGKILIQDMEDCSRGVALLERLLHSDSSFTPKQELYFNLFRCYQKAGDSQKAKQMQDLLQQQFPTDPLTLALFDQQPAARDNTKKGDSVYQRIYELFLQENYQQALTQKKMADSAYGATYWSPQLLYIESIYYVQQRQDSTAIRILSLIRSQYPNHPLVPRATALIEALSNRANLEASLHLPNTPSASTATPATTASATTTDPSNSTPPSNGAIEFIKADQSPHRVVLVLTDVDPALANETKNAMQRFNRENYAANSLNATLQPFSEKIRLVQVTSFTNADQAIQYKERAQPKTRTDIAPWLSVSQFYWMIISEDNWERLNRGKDLELYKNFLNKNRP